MAYYEFEERRTYVSSGNKVYIWADICPNNHFRLHAGPSSDLQMPCFPSLEGSIVQLHVN